MNRRNFFQYAAGTAAVALQDKVIEHAWAARSENKGTPEEVAASYAADDEAPGAEAAGPPE